MVEGGQDRQENKEHTRALLTWLRAARDTYLTEVTEHEQTYGKANNEGWSFYNSRLRPERSSNRDAYFDVKQKSAISFHGLDDYDADKLVQHIVDFVSTPENTGREILILDAMSTGKAAADLRDEVRKKIPEANITVLASTLTPRRDVSYNALEFNGDTLTDEYSDPVFEEIAKRKKTGAALLVTFFRPVGALWGQSENPLPDNPYVLYALYVRLRKLFHETEEKGLLFLQAHSDGTDLLFLSALFKKVGAQALLTNRANEVALLKKDAALCPQSQLKSKNGHVELPSVPQLLEKHWDLVTQYWQIPKPRVRMPARTERSEG